MLSSYLADRIIPGRPGDWIIPGRERGRRGGWHSSECCCSVSSRPPSSTWLRTLWPVTSSTLSAVMVCMPLQSSLNKVLLMRQTSPTDGSSIGASQWCSHLVNASEVSPVTASLPFRPLLVVVRPRRGAVGLRVRARGLLWALSDEANRHVGTHSSDATTYLLTYTARWVTCHQTTYVQQQPWWWQLYCDDPTDTCAAYCVITYKTNSRLVCDHTVSRTRHDNPTASTLQSPWLLLYVIAGTSSDDIWLNVLYHHIGSPTNNSELDVTNRQVTSAQSQSSLRICLRTRSIVVLVKSLYSSRRMYSCIGGRFTRACGRVSGGLL